MTGKETCYPLNLLNWNNYWKWNDKVKKNIKVDGVVWIAENGVIGYSFYFGDSDEPVTYEMPLKAIVRETLTWFAKADGTIAEEHIGDVQRLHASLMSAANIVKHELNRVEEPND